MLQNTPYSVRLASVLISITLVLVGLYWMQDLLILVAFAMIMAMVLLPICSWLEQKGLPRSLSIAICLIITVAILIGIVFLLAFQLIEFANDWPLFIKKAETWISGLQSFLSRNLNISRKKQMLELSNQTIGLLKNSGSILSTTFSTLLHSLTTMILIPIFMFFSFEKRRLNLAKIFIFLKNNIENQVILT
jgi:predicted PurR-regulated permease PerM